MAESKEPTKEEVWDALNKEYISDKERDKRIIRGFIAKLRVSAIETSQPSNAQDIQEWLKNEKK